MTFKISDLIVRAEELMHRNSKQKDELINDIVVFLENENKSDLISDLKKITFEYVQLYKGFHPPKRHDEEWKRGKRDLLLFLNKLK